MKTLYILAQIATVLFVAPVVIMTVTLGAFMLGIVPDEMFVTIMNTCHKYSFMSLVIGNR